MPFSMLLGCKEAKREMSQANDAGGRVPFVRFEKSIGFEKSGPREIRGFERSLR